MCSSDLRRYLQDLRAANPMLRSAAERMAINMPIQGSAADILKLAMIAIRKRLQQASLSTRMILQVHDELVFDVPKKEVAEVATLVRQEMAHAYTLSVPLGVEVKSGPNWNDLKSVKS